MDAATPKIVFQSWIKYFILKGSNFQWLFFDMSIMSSIFMLPMATANFRVGVASSKVFSGRYNL